MNRARTLGLPIAPKDVFLLKTPRALAEHLGTSTHRAAPADAPREDGPFPPTPLILRQRELGGSLTRFAQARTLQAPEGTGFTDAVRAANAVVAAHPALRLRLRTEHGVWTLRTEPTRDITVVRPDTTDATAVANEAAGQLDPASGEVIAFAWLESSRTLVVTVHHLAVDAGWGLLDMAGTAWSQRQVTPRTTTFLTVPTARDKKRRLVIDEARAAELWEAVRVDRVAEYVALNREFVN